MNKKGYLLIEALVASVLLSLAGAGLYRGIAQGIQAERLIRQTNAIHDPLRVLWMKSGKDLRNMVSLRDYRFTGNQDEMAFPVNDTASRLSRVRYFTKDGKLIRSEEALPEKFVKERPLQRVLLKNVERIRFEYAYLDEEERLFFKPVWTEEPYFGIPKAVKMDIKLKTGEKTFSRLISIPQGRWGHE